MFGELYYYILVLFVKGSVNGTNLFLTDCLSEPAKS